MWYPSFKTDISIIEKVQRRATKLVKSIKDKTYEEKWKIYGKLQNLEERRLRGDLIQIYKIINGVDKIKLVNGVNYAKSLSLIIRKSNNLRLVREINKKSSGRFNFLTNRIVSTSNNLSSVTVSATTANKIKACIDREVFGSND
ncbi:unnamed protein product [Brachionus calyciflorus]|uniref:Uncharacterized protein n=1 Tax=Brachionus calyciflorus TaxID=104777 RepID=A0A813TGF9_9BILA|nr:unnamed protein product [Brachionus calyciflorus]